MLNRVKSNLFKWRLHPAVVKAKKLIPSNLKKVIANSRNSNKFKLLKLSVDQGKNILPKYLTLELTNNCNAGCTFCPQPIIMTRTKGILKEPIFERVLDICKKHQVSMVMLGGLGEPFVDKKIVDKIIRLREIGVQVNATTNGSMFRHVDLDQLIKSGVELLSISMDAINTDYLREIKPDITETVEDMEAAVKELYDRRNKLGSSTPKLVMRYQLTQSSNNYEDKDAETEEIMKRAKNICDEVVIRKQHDWLGTMTEETSYEDDQRQIPNEENVCNYLVNTMNITWNGDISLCCMDFDNKVILGNIMTEKVEDIFNSDHLKNARNQYVAGTIKNHEFCGMCYKGEQCA